MKQVVKPKVSGTAPTMSARYNDSDTFEYQGLTLTVGDKVIIKGEDSTFVFRYHTTTTDGKEWITVREVGRGYRSFHTHRIVVEQKKCKTHPKYGAKRAPRTGCSQCWALYREARGEE